MNTRNPLYRSLLWRGIYYAVAFGFNIMIARHFAAVVSGSIYYISSVYAMVILLTGLSIESGITYYAARNEINTGKLLSFSVLWSGIMGLLTFAVVFLSVHDSYAGISRQLMLVSSVSFICGNLLVSYCTGLFYARNDFVFPSLVNICITILLVMLIPYRGKSIIPCINDTTYFYVYFSSWLLQGILLAIAARMKFIRSAFDGFLNLREFRLLFRYCVLAFAGNIIFFLLYRVDYWFVKAYCTPEALGNYIQVSKLGQLFFILPTVLAGTVFPLTAGGQKENMNSLLPLISRNILLLYLLACIFLACTGKWLFPWVFGISFTGMYMPFLLLVPGILSLSGLFTLTAYYAGKNRIKVNIRGSMLALLVILAGDAIFIPVYGINAAALVSSTGYIIYQAYVLFIFKKEYQRPVMDFFVPRFSDWKMLKKYYPGNTETI